MTVSLKKINYVYPSLIVMCVYYKTVNQQNQLQHCLRQLHNQCMATQRHASVQQLIYQAPNGDRCTSLQRLLQRSNGHKIQLCASRMVPYLLPIGIMSPQCCTGWLLLPHSGCGPAFPLFNGMTRNQSCN